MLPEQGPKHSLSIMPRTDFATMYGLVKDKLKAQLECMDLYQIVKALAKMQGDGRGKDNNYNGDQLDRQTFKWKPKAKESVSGDDFDGDEGTNPVGGGVPPPPPPPPPLPPPFGPISRHVRRLDPAGLDPADLSSGTLPVEKWLQAIQNAGIDLVALMEKELRYGQVGRLGESKSPSFGLCPILFRPSSNGQGQHLAYHCAILS